MKILNTIIPALAALTLSSTWASAQLIVDDGSSPAFSATTNITPAYGYYLYDATGGLINQQDVNGLGTFATMTELANTATYPGNGTHLTVEGTSYFTGLLDSIEHGSGGNVLPLATFTLGASAPSSFLVGVDTDTFNDSDSQLTLTITGDATAAVAGNQNSESSNNNDFYYFLVTGASSGDVITLSAAAPSPYTDIAAVTFDSAPLSAPEPSTWALLLSGLGFLVLKVSRRRFQVLG